MPMPILIMNLQSGNMTDAPYYFLLARDQLMFPADPVCVPIRIWGAMLIQRVADLDRQGVVGLPCRSEGPSEPPWHIVQGRQPSSLHDRG